MIKTLLFAVCMFIISGCSSSPKWGPMPWGSLYDSKGNPKYVRTYASDDYTVVFRGDHPRGIKTKSVVYTYDASRATWRVKEKTSGDIIDITDKNFYPRIGKTNHLGRRIEFHNLPVDIQRDLRIEYNKRWN